MEKISLLKKRQSLFFSSLIVCLCIVFGDWGKMYYYKVIKDFSGAQDYVNLNVIISSVAFLLLAFLSDIWCRKKMLYISVFLLILSGIFLKLNSPMLSTISIAIAPVTPIAIAAYCDVHFTNEREPNVINAFIIRPIPWILFPFVSSSSSIFFSTDMCVGGVTFALVVLLFIDRRDKDARKFNFGVLEAVKIYGLRVFIAITCAFFLSNWAWSLLFYYLEGLTNKSIVASNFMLAPGICFFLGALFVRTIIKKRAIFTACFKGNSNSKIKSNYLKLIIFISMGSIPFIILISYLIVIINKDQSNFVLNSLPLFTFFGGIFIPAIYAFFGSRLKYHSLGLVYAWLEVVQSLSEFLGAKSETFSFFTKELDHIIIFSIVLAFLSLGALFFLPKENSVESTSSQGNN